MRNPAVILQDYSAWYQANHTPETIRRIQKALKVPETGILNLETLQAIIDFQKETQLGQDGLLSREHIARLLEHENEKSIIQESARANLDRLSQEVRGSIEVQNAGKIRRFHGRLKGLAEATEVLVNQLEEADTLTAGMDVAMQGINWALGRKSETPVQQLTRMHSEYRLQARALANDIGNELQNNQSLNIQQRQTLEEYKRGLEGLTQSRPVINPLKMFVNNVKNIPEYVTSAAYGTVGIVE